jgi:hypothetical protein
VTFFSSEAIRGASNTRQTNASRLVIALPIIASIRQVQIAAGFDLYCATLQLLAKRSRSDRFWSVRTGSIGLAESNGIFARNLLEIEKFGDVD